jgi:hypothetical protein
LALMRSSRPSNSFGCRSASSLTSSALTFFTRT